jgi:hypothetical protein
MIGITLPFQKGKSPSICESKWYSDLTKNPVFGTVLALAGSGGKFDCAIPVKLFMNFLHERYISTDMRKNMISKISLYTALS